MLNDLKFVQGAVAKKDYVPELTHFRIGDGRCYGFNGVLAISTPIDLDVVAAPKAAPFVKAISSAPDGLPIVLNLTEAGRISVKAGTFKAFVDCHPADTEVPEMKPAGVMVDLPGDLLPILKAMQPFIGVDASRPWAMGLLLSGQSAFATNNVILAEHWLPLEFADPLNIPSEAIKEMIRINKEPTAIQVETGAVTFHYANGAWLRTQLYTSEWPDLAAVLDRECEPTAFPDGFFDAVERLATFADKTARLHLRGGVLATSAHEGDGALVELDDFGGVGCHWLHQMRLLNGVADSIDFGQYPAPCLFFGGMMRGAIVGLRINDAV